MTSTAERVQQKAACSFIFGPQVFKCFDTKATVCPNFSHSFQRKDARLLEGEGGEET